VPYKVEHTCFVYIQQLNFCTTYLIGHLSPHPPLAPQIRQFVVNIVRSYRNLLTYLNRPLICIVTQFLVEQLTISSCACSTFYSRPVCK